MALTLSKTGITTGQTIQVSHVTQSIDALTGTVAYDIKISGSLNLTGSVASFNGFVGNLTGTSSWATNSTLANTSSKANNILISNFGTTDKFYRVTFVDPLYIPTVGNNFYDQLMVDSGSDGSGIYYNPSVNRLFVGSISSSDYSNDVRLYGTSSYSLTSSVVQNYTPGTANFTTIYPQGTIYTKFDNVYQSGSSDFDLFSSSLSNLTGTRTLDANFYNNANTYNSKILKFRIVGKFSNTSGDNFESYVKLGNSILSSTNIGSVQLQFNTNKPFEILYDIIFQNNTIKTCGSIRYCDQTGDLRAVPISNLYTSDPVDTGQMPGDIQFVVSGSSNTIMTGSLAYIEFLN